MTIVWQIFGWLFTLLFALFLLSMVLTHNWFAAAVMLVLILLCLPPLGVWLKNSYGFSLHWAIRLVAILLLMFAFSRLFLGGTQTSIYHSQEIEDQFESIYARMMTEWPVSYEERYLNTSYGKVYVIISGPEDAPPMLLLHASGVGSWSWKHNVSALSHRYRVYAIDTIGDVGRSEYADLGHVMSEKRHHAEHYGEVMDLLDIDKAYVVGASEGGFIASNIAIHTPDRVRKLVCLGPMGYSGTSGAIIRITLSQLYPLKPIQDATFKWAFSDAPVLVREYAEWFPLLMSGAVPSHVMPTQLLPDERQSLSMPVMFVFGERDNLVGDPAAARDLVQDIADVRVEVVEAGHLMGAEVPDEISAFLLDFCQ